MDTITDLYLQLQNSTMLADARGLPMTSDALRKLAEVVLTEGASNCRGVLDALSAVTSTEAEARDVVAAPLERPAAACIPARHRRLQVVQQRRRPGDEGTSLLLGPSRAW